MITLHKKENITWWTAVGSIVLAYILVNYIHPEWLGRLIGLGLIYGVLVVILLMVVLNKKNFQKVNEKKFKSKESAERALKNINIFSQIFAALVLIGIIYLSLSYIKTVIYLVGGNPMASRHAVVTNASASIIPFGNYLFQSVYFSQEKSQSYLLFLHKPLKVSESYDVLYAPPTDLILEAE